MPELLQTKINLVDIVQVDVYPLIRIEVVIVPRHRRSNSSIFLFRNLFVIHFSTTLFSWASNKWILLKRTPKLKSFSKKYNPPPGIKRFPSQYFHQTII